MSITYIYLVMRDTDDEGGSRTEIRGLYTTLKEANAAARVDLTNEWALDLLKSHEVETDPETGMVSVDAEFPEGEVMRVYIEKKEAPKGLSTASKTEAPAPKDVWIIMQTDYDHHTDEVGRSHLPSSVAYESLLEANEAARWELCETCGFDELEELDHMDRHEQNIGSSTERYVGYAYVREDERDNVKVEVEKLTLKRAPRQSKVSKKRKIEEVIEISSD